MKKKTTQKSSKDNSPNKVAGSMAAAYAILSLGTFLSGCKTNIENIAETGNNTIDNAIETENNNISEEQLMVAKELNQAYSNKALRALESVHTQLGEEAYFEEISKLGSAEATSNQGEYIAELITDVTQKAGEEKAVEVMRACGYQCISPSIITTAKKAYEDSADLPQFIEELRKYGIGENMTIEGNTIHASYEHCYCDIPDSGKRLNKCYCQCSCGWYEKLFTEVVQHSVEVELVQSIKGGAESCEFIITI